MISIATHIHLVSGVGTAIYRLNSFDRALQACGVANYNHVKLSSIIPAGCLVTKESIPHKCVIWEGAILPAVSSVVYAFDGQSAVSCIGAAINANAKLPGMIFEHSGEGVDVSIIKKQVDEMILTGMDDRNWKIKATLFVVAEAVAPPDLWACAYSCAYYT